MTKNLFLIEEIKAPYIAKVDRSESGYMAKRSAVISTPADDVEAEDVFLVTLANDDTNLKLQEGDIVQADLDFKVYSDEKERLYQIIWAKNVIKLEKANVSINYGL